MGASATKTEYSKIKPRESNIKYNNLQFHERIGEGGYSFVHRVTFKKSCNGYKEAAAKTVFQASAEEEVVDIMSKLHHPHIVTLLGFCQTGHVDTDVIVMEFAPNGSLHDYLSDATKPLTYSLQRKWIKESAYAIQYLHGENILHKAIKAKNCLLFEHNTLKLCDFGLMQGIVQSQKRAYQYMAPEILQGNEEGGAVFSKPADIYGYGMLVLEIWTRKPPFDEMEWLKVVNEVCNGKQPDIPADCPAILSDMMKLCWDVDPKKRPTIESVLEGYEWDMVRKYHPQHQGTSLEVRNIVCCPNGDMVVLEGYRYGAQAKLYLLGSDGQCKTTLTIPDQDNHKPHITSICVSPQGHIMMLDGSIELNTCYVSVFDGNGKYLNCFNCLTRDPKYSFCIESCCITTDRDGQVLVGNARSRSITIHQCPNGELIGTIRIRGRIGPVFGLSNTMVVNSKKEILLHSQKNCTPFTRVYALDYSGNVLYTFGPTIGRDLDYRAWEPWAYGIACDASDNIYIAMGYRDNASSNGLIQKYSPTPSRIWTGTTPSRIRWTGILLQCIAKDFCIAKEYMPSGLFMTCDGLLVVADKNSILVYSDRL